MHDVIWPVPAGQTREAGRGLHALLVWTWHTVPHSPRCSRCFALSIFCGEAGRHSRPYGRYDTGSRKPPALLDQPAVAHGKRMLLVTEGCDPPSIPP